MAGAGTAVLATGEGLVAGLATGPLFGPTAPGLWGLAATVAGHPYSLGTRGAGTWVTQQ